MMMLAALLGPDVVAIAFSHSGSTAAVFDAIELARKNGARTIAVTNYPDSSIAQAVGIVLCSTAQRDRKTADLNPSRAMRAVQSKRKL